MLHVHGVCRWIHFVQLCFYALLKPIKKDPTKVRSVPLSHSSCACVQACVSDDLIDDF